VRLQRRLGSALASIIIIMFSMTTSRAMADLTYKQSLLQGLKTMSVLVEGIDSNSCGLTADQVKTSVLYTLSQSRISVSSNLGVPTDLYINIDILSDCSAADIDIELSTIATIMQTKRIVFNAGVWKAGTLLTGGDMESRVNSSVNELTQQFVVDWNAANP
jgi:hypothetical protein